MVEAHPESTSASSSTSRALLVIAGSGRSGTSLMAGMSGRLGLHIPQPEVKANDTNPRGFGEPRWAVAFHKQALAAVGVSHDDGRPQAWDEAAGVLERPRLRARLKEWLEGEFEQADRVVVKDPRLGWFLRLYSELSAELDARFAVITMLRDPAETMQSKLTYYGGRSGTTRAAGWLNMMLGTEYQSRDMRRAIIRYDDLLTHWRPTLEQADRELGIGLVDQATPEAVKEADGLIDPTLRRTSPDWAELGLAPWLADLAQETHDALSELAASPAGEQVTSTARMDAVREKYAAAYEDAEALVKSSLNATRATAQRRTRQRMQAEAATGAGEGEQPRGSDGPGSGMGGLKQKLAAAKRRARGDGGSA
jgi:hypothetical protein